MANVTRDQFSEPRGVTRKRFQKATFFTDADINEQIDASSWIDRRALSAVLAHTNYRFGDGFSVVGTGGSLQVTIKAGRAAVQLASQAAVMVYLESDYTLSGFSAFSAKRTDYVYLDVRETEYSPSEDSNLVNPDIGEETARDIRLVYSFGISEGAAPGTPPAGHAFIVLATVTSSNNTLSSDKVTSLLPNYYYGKYDIGSYNLVRNGGFDIWNGSSLMYWTNTLGQESSDYSVKKYGPCSIRLTGTNKGIPPHVLRQTINLSNFTSRNLKMFCWVRVSSVANAVTFTMSLVDPSGITVASKSLEMSVSSTWVKLEMDDFTIPDSLDATGDYEVRLAYTGETSYQYWFDGVTWFIGKQTREFEPNPLDVIEFNLSLAQKVIFQDFSISYTSADAVGLDDNTKRMINTASGAGDATKTTLKTEHRHSPRYLKAVLRASVWVENANCTAYLILTVGSSSVSSAAITATSPTVVNVEVSLLSGFDSGSSYDVSVGLRNVSTGAGSVYAKRVSITAEGL